MTKWSNLFLFVIIASTITGLAACVKQGKSESDFSKHPPIIVGYAQLGSESAWRNANSDSVIQAAKKAKVRLIFKNAEGDQQQQIKILHEFIIQHVDVIAFPPIIVSGWDSILKEAKNAGIPVIISDRMVKIKDPTLYVSTIGSNFKEEGERTAKWLVNNTKKSNKKINILELEGLTGSAPAVDRKKGFAQIISKHSNMKIIESVHGDFIRAKGKNLVSAALKKYGRKINVIYAHNDEMALGAMAAIEEYGLKPGKDILILSIDGQKEALQAIKTGKLNVSVECTPLLGPDIIKAAINLKSGKTIPRKMTPVEKIFTKENVAKELPYRKY
ncbi:MAG: ABC transporter substrate-binding protein [Bacteroidota bacterium]|nr:ABC transporter substrate-binding protein [Bacteroidota bacterium]